MPRKTQKPINAEIKQATTKIKEKTYEGFSVRENVVELFDEDG